MHIRDGNGNFGINHGFINPIPIEVSDFPFLFEGNRVMVKMYREGGID